MNEATVDLPGLTDLWNSVAGNRADVTHNTAAIVITCAAWAVQNKILENKKKNMNKNMFFHV